MTNIIPGINNDDPGAVLSAEDVFGPNPWIANPVVTGPNKKNQIVEFPQNPLYYATEPTANLVLQMVSGTGIDENNPYAGNQRYSASNSQLVVTLPGGAWINAGLVAGFFTHGYPLDMIAVMIQRLLSAS